MRYDNEPNGVFMYSLVIGFIIINAAHIIPLTTNNLFWDYVILLIVTIVIAYFVAELYISSLFRKILNKLHIPYTVKKYIWYDLEGKKDTFVLVKYYDRKIAYYGRLGLYEEYQRFPQIMLKDYEVLKLENSYHNGITIEDYNNTGRMILLDTSKADSIEFI